MSFADLEPGVHTTAVRDHWWWRPGWREGRYFYACHLPLGHESELLGLVRDYREALSDQPGLDLIPDKWLHLTVQGIGFTDEIGDGELRAIMTDVRRRLGELEPVSLTVASAVVSDEAIVLPVDPSSGVAALKETVHVAVERVLGDRLGSTGRPYRPHVSIAYVNVDGPAQPYVEAVESVPARPTTLTIRSVPLLSMHRDHRMYEWDIVGVAALGADTR